MALAPLSTALGLEEAGTEDDAAFAGPSAKDGCWAIPFTEERDAIDSSKTRNRSAVSTFIKTR
jgi:hypothetical protein